jgi:hypothetical protein
MASDDRDAGGDPDDGNPAQLSLVANEKMDGVMKARELSKQRALVGARKLVDTLSRPKVMFTLSSSGYCAIHSLVIRDFSIYVFLGSLVFGAIAAMVISWLSNRLPSSST